MTLRSAFGSCVRVDTRSLAAFRVFLALLVLADLALRSRNFSFYYTDDGVVPQSLAMEHTPDYAVSVYYLTSDPALIAGLFVLTGLIALQLLIGYKTRLATICAFLLVVSLDHHNPFVLSYADTLFRLLLFWAIFLPLGERWSVDAVHRERAPRASVANVATAFALGQMVFMYVVNGVHKRESDLWTSGEATPLIFGIDEMTFLLGDALRAFPTLLQYGGLAWYFMLLGSPLLILLWGRPRMLLTFMFVGAHASFAVTVRIGAFAYVAIAGLTLFLQAQFWRDAGAVARAAGLADRLESLRSALDRRGRRVAAALPRASVDDERLRRARSGVYRGSLVVIVATILIVALVVPAQVWVFMDDDRPEEERFEEALEETTGVEHVHTVAAAAGIEQPPWSVFAPNPRSTDRYYVFPAETVGGDRIDVFNDGRPLTYDRAHDELQKQHDTYRQRFYMNSVRRGGSHTEVAPLLADHLCESWPDEHGDELVRIDVYEVTETITQETIDAPEDRERSFSLRYRHGCGDNDPGPIDPPG
ncbi:HTTM domain-containing protein [Halovivax sp.]|uniref:HTTM domain-containing protein n=1 Tax=Halovivax sp. TaxID=1935978 RepID=UPI0025C5639A|nr:HTTM domain-containing protein [Halovivax sp.]